MAIATKMLVGLKFFAGNGDNYVTGGRVFAFISIQHNIVVVQTMYLQRHAIWQMQG